MRRIILLHFVLLAPFSVLCQSNDSLFKKLSIGISYESNVNYRQLKYSASNDWIKTIRNKEEILKYGFVSGLNVKYRLNKKFSLECALLFANKGMKTRKRALIWDTPSKEYPVKSQTKFSFFYSDIPLKLNYNFQIKNTKLYILSGFSFNNFINKKTTIITYFSDGNKTKTAHKQDWEYKSDTYSVIFGLGITIPLSNQLLLNVESIYRQGIVSIVENKNTGEYLYAVGLNTKLFYQFKKRK